MKSSCTEKRCSLIGPIKSICVKLLYLFLLIQAVIAASDCAIPVHYLKPPKLSDACIGRRVLCHRPMRQDVPNIGIEQSNDVYIMHNYGHGGNGWTLAPGCVKYLLHAFQERILVDKNAPIVIIGAGVVGLVTAYQLVKLGCNDITIIADHFDDLTSHKAGGFCAPVVSGKTIDDVQKLISRMSVDAYRFYAEIARGENDDFDCQCATFVPVYLKKEEACRLQPYIDEGLMKPGIDVVVDFSNGKRYEGMQVFSDAIFMQTGKLMASLSKRLQGKVVFKQGHVDSFDNIGASYIFNCAGLGARELNNDNNVNTGQGHLVFLQDQLPEELTYMIGFQADKGVTESGQAVNRSVYMFPKQSAGSYGSIGVLGGTYIEGADLTTPNEHEFDLLIERARDFFGSY